MNERGFTRTPSEGQKTRLGVETGEPEAVILQSHRGGHREEPPETTSGAGREVTPLGTAMEGTAVPLEAAGGLALREAARSHRHPLGADRTRTSGAGTPGASIPSSPPALRRPPRPGTRVLNTPQPFSFAVASASSGSGQRKLHLDRMKPLPWDLVTRKTWQSFFSYGLITLSVISYNHVFLLYVTWNQELVFQNFAKRSQIFYSSKNRNLTGRAVLCDHRFSGDVMAAG